MDNEPARPRSAPFRGTTPVRRSDSVWLVSDTSLPAFATWSSFPFEGNLRVKKLDDPVAVEPPRKGEDANDCAKCHAPDKAYIWVNENWRVRCMDRPSGLPMVLILESRSHLDLGDLPNMLAAELGVMTVRLERAIRSLDGVARVHVNRWGDGAAHLHLWFMARPHGRLQLRGSFLSMWDEILPPVSESTWREDLALIAAWLAEFGGEALAQPPRIEWKAPAKFGPDPLPSVALAGPDDIATTDNGSGPDTPAGDGAAAPAAQGPAPGPDAGDGDSAPATDNGAATPSAAAGNTAEAVGTGNTAEAVTGGNTAEAVAAGSTAPAAGGPDPSAGTSDAGAPAGGGAVPATRPGARDSAGKEAVGRVGVPAGPATAEAGPAAAEAATAVDGAAAKG